MKILGNYIGLFSSCAKYEFSGNVNCAIYSTLFVLSLFINKYVLSVLQFTFPTVFQGWQTLVVLIVFKCLTLSQKVEVSSLSFMTLGNLLPHCVFYIGAIVSGSKALSSLPVPMFVCICNLAPTCMFLLDQWAEPVIVRWVGMIAAFISIVTSLCVLLFDMTFPFAESGYSWLLAHVVFVIAQTLHVRITNPRYTDLDRVFYGNIVSVVLLTPASLYLEEAFHALQFQHRRQMKFYAGCLLSGILTAVLQLWVAKGKSQNQAVARLAAGILAFPVFSPYQLPSVIEGLIFLNLFANIFIPDNILSQDKNVEITDIKCVQSL